MPPATSGDEVPATVPILPKSVLPSGVKISDIAYLASENSEQLGSPHYQQGKQIFWPTFFDWSVDHPEVLNGYMTELMLNNSADIFSVFPIKLTKQSRFVKHRIIITPQMPEIGTRKVPGKQIHYKVEMVSGSALYTGQGFQADYDYLRTPGGMEYFDRMTGAVISDLWAMIMYNAYKEFQAVPSHYVRPDQLFPYDEMPRTAEEVFEWQRKWHGVLNKSPQAIGNLCATISKIFDRNNSDKIAKIITTMDCVNFINTRDLTNIDYNKSGAQAQVNRASGNTIRKLHGIETVGIQLMETKLHSDSHDTVMKSEFVTGGMASYVERCQSMKPEDYRSEYRDPMFSSWTANKVQKYSFLNFLHHCPEFIPLNANDDHHLRGGLNVNLLFDLAEDPARAFQNARTRMAGNEEQLHQFLAYHPRNRLDSTTSDKWSPIFFFGEISECHVKTRALNFPYKTMEHAVTSVLTEDDKRAIEQGVELAHMLSNPSVNPTTLYGGVGLGGIGVTQYDTYNPAELFPAGREAVPWGFGTMGGFLALFDFISDNPTSNALRADVREKVRNFVPAFEKFVTRMGEVNKGHPGLDLNMIGPVTPIGATQIGALNSCWHLLVMDSYSRHVRGARETKLHFKTNDSIVGMLTRGRAVADDDYTRAAWGKINELDITPMAKYLQFSPLTENKHFMARWKATGSMPLFARIAARAVLLQPINLRGLDAWHANNVAIPLGGMAARPFESQFMESMYFLAEGQIGNTYFSGLDDTLSFDAGSRHFSIQMFLHFKIWIDDPTKFIVAPFTRGLQILGGKGNKFINDDPDLGVIEYGSDAWHRIMRDFGSGEKMGDYSIIPVLQSYNHAIEGQFKCRHLDMRGYWDRPDFVTLLHESESFTPERHDVMYPNEFLTNLIYPFNARSLPDLELKRANFIEIQNRHRVNAHIHQTTQFVYNPLSGDMDEIGSSHLWGREVDGIVQIQNSSAPVQLNDKQ